MKSPHLQLALLLLSAVCTGAATFEERVELLFRPPVAEQMALSPDGKHVAYSTQAGGELRVIILRVDDPLQKITVNVDDARSVPFSAEKQPARLRFLRWATANRLVLAPTEERITFTGNDAKIIAPIFAVDADGQNPKTLLDGDEFAVPREGIANVAVVDSGESSGLQQIPVPAPQSFIPRSPQIVGFEPGNREQLILRLPPVGRTIPSELILLNVHTGEQTSVDPLEVRGSNDGRLPADPALRNEVDRELSRKFPQRHVALMDWSEGMRHVLVRVTGGSDPGRVFVFQRPLNQVIEIFRAAPWLKSSNLNESRFVEVEAQRGLRLSGYITWPRAPRLKPPPLLVIFPSGFPGRTQPDFDPEAQVFSDLGLAVLRLNHRYARSVPAGERDLARAAIDRISVDDAATMIQKVAAQFPERPIDVKHVAALGRGFGGYLAVRALQLRPEVFRAGIAIDAPMHLRAWIDPIEGPAARDIPRDIFSGDGVPWAKLSVRDNVDTLQQPVFFLVEPTRNQAVDLSVDTVRSALKRLKRPADYLDLDPAFGLALPKTRAAVYRKIEEFLNLRLYDYRVKIGPATEVK